MDGQLQDSIPPYQYQPLNRARREFRLLRILARLKDDRRVHFELQRFSIDRCPPYVALSYTWGSPTPAYSVLVSTAGHQDGFLDIRENLHCFMVSASDVPLNLAQEMDRGPDTSERVDATWLWIDQICIDQSNLDERANQIQQMADIYSKAQATFIWLGKSFPCSDTMMKYLNIGTTGVDDDDDDDQWSQVAELQRLEAGGTSNWTASTWTERDVLLTHAKDMGGLPSIRRVLDSPYWSRLWINQEIGVARRVLVMVGSRLCEFGKFTGGISHLAELLRPWTATTDLQQRYKTNMHRTNMKYGLYRKQPGDWREAATYMDGGCSDARDKVYGLMALVHPHLRLLPDYMAPADQVLIEMLRRLCREEFEEQRACSGGLTCLHGEHGLAGMPHKVWRWSVAMELVQPSEISKSRQRNLVRFWALKVGLLPQFIRPKELDRPGRAARPGGSLYKVAEEEYASCMSRPSDIEPIHRVED